ncbi:MAG TPA: FUSC family protein [Pseudonocardia sp.]|nr:FUSC family protein [Pseudonocardia sp.]
MRRPEWFAELRTWLSGVDPGWARLRLASLAVASMALATGIMAVAEAVADVSVTVVLFAAVLAMVSNLSVNEADPARRRMTTALMVLPAVASTLLGTLLAPYRIPADVVFVLVMALAVYVRHYGPRGTALGMAGFMPYFFTQFLKASTSELPWLLVAVVVGITTSLVLSAWLFPERADRTLLRLVRAFQARMHILIRELAEALEEAGAGGGLERRLRAVQVARTRLNDTALLVADHLDRLADSAADSVSDSATDKATDKVTDAATGSEHAEVGSDPGGLTLHVLDAELAAERLAVATRRMLEESAERDPADVSALIIGVQALERATRSGMSVSSSATARSAAEDAVTGLVTRSGHGIEREQRVAFAVVRLAEALVLVDQDEQAARSKSAHTSGPARGSKRKAGREESVPAGDTGGDGPPAIARRAPEGPDTSPPTEAIRIPITDVPTVGLPPVGVPIGDTTAASGGDPSGPDATPGPEAAVGDEHTDDSTPGLRLATRQAIQVSVATSLAIVAGELISPARWYWAVIAAFVVFAGTTSRGDLLNRGLQRVIGTIGGVFAGVGLAAWVGEARLPALILMFGCVFFAMYLVRVSQALMAFWITAVLALLYGLIGQFSTHTLLLRVEETAMGATLGILTGYLILPKKTRDVFGEALDDMVDAADAVLAAATQRLLGHPTPQSPLVMARDMDVALGTLRARAKPLDNPLPGRRGRTSYHRALRVLTAVDHYSRSLARSSVWISDPTWAPTLVPAVDRVRGNVDVLRSRVQHRASGELASAEELIDAAEEHAARAAPGARRLGQLAAMRVIRRLDQVVVGFAADLGSPAPTGAAPTMVGRPGD